jgi:phosphoglycerate kinase
MCFTFLAALGNEVGTSHVEPELFGAARTLLETHPGIILPTDLVALCPEGNHEDEVRLFGTELPEGWQGTDIGPRTYRDFARAIEKAATVLWNGPMGISEDARFTAGTAAVAEAIASSSAFSVVGGGDTAAALDKLGLQAEVSHVSTGGGATLELLEKGDLPGLSALRDSAWSVGHLVGPSL